MEKTQSAAVRTSRSLGASCVTLAARFHLKSAPRRAIAVKWCAFGLREDSFLGWRGFLLLRAFASQPASSRQQ